MSLSKDAPASTSNTTSTNTNKAAMVNLAAEKHAQVATQSLHDYRSSPQTHASHHISSSSNHALENVIPVKHFSTLALIGLCYCILNSWTAASASLSIALVSGGPSVTLWGMVVAFFGVMATALSMAEICHVYPTTGGQYVE
uniref:Choline transporter n=1 Tax=Melanopsichium pennsylvanicum 4 TaxID=1398559 RepID=A0A077R4V3_9BASI|nr:choline transporter [Melanopsichium pennsylvanicum 4]